MSPEYNSSQDLQQEIQRIKKEYARRDKEIPKHRYAKSTGGNEFINQRRQDEAWKILNAHQVLPLKSKKILDVGCGIGAWLALFSKWGAQESFLAGVDLDEDKTLELKKRIPDSLTCCAEASNLPWRNESFDIITQATLFTSIKNDGLKKFAAAEMLRVLKKDGVILWYDFRYDNPWNSQVKGIERDEIRLLFSPCSVSLRSVTLLPPVARLLAPLFPALAAALEKIPFLRSHYLAVIRK